MWWYQNNNPLQPDAPEKLEPPMEPKPTDLVYFFSAMEERFQHWTFEYINKLEAFRSRHGEGLERIFGRLNEIARVVEEDGAYTQVPKPPPNAY